MKKLTSRDSIKKRKSNNYTRYGNLDEMGLNDFGLTDWLLPS